MLGWRDAMQQALYGPDGFYVRGPGPEAHFRTSVTASPLFADAIRSLVVAADDTLGRPARLDVVDVGAGDGSLLRAVAAGRTDDQQDRWRMCGVELRPRPSGLPPDLDWSHEPDDGLVGVVVAHELLDNVPLDVVEVTETGLRLVEVDEHGVEQLGGPPEASELEWLAQWWPLAAAAPGDRAEVGRPRDQMWQQLLGRIERGVAVAVDYAHNREQRAAGGWAAGTLTGYR